MSTVRTQGIGFLSDYRRMNVAITRAKSFLFVVGNSRLLKKNEHWSGQIASVQKKYTFESKD